MPASRSDLSKRFATLQAAEVARHLSAMREPAGSRPMISAMHHFRRVRSAGTYGMDRGYSDALLFDYKPGGAPRQAFGTLCRCARSLKPSAEMFVNSRLGSDIAEMFESTGKLPARSSVKPGLDDYDVSCDGSASAVAFHRERIAVAQSYEDRKLGNGQSIGEFGEDAWELAGPPKD